MRLARSGWHLALLLATAGLVTSGNGGGQRRGGSERRRKLHRVQNGQCSYTFILPEMEGCQGGGDHIAGSNVVQRDAPPGESEWSAQKLQHLEMAMENNTQWLQKNTKEDHLKKVGNRTAPAPIHFYCIDTKPMQVNGRQLTTYFKISTFVFCGRKTVKQV